MLLLLLLLDHLLSNLLSNLLLLSGLSLLLLQLGGLRLDKLELLQRKGKLLCLHGLTLLLLLLLLLLRRKETDLSLKLGYLLRLGTDDSLYRIRVGAVA